MRSDGAVAAGVLAASIEFEIAALPIVAAAVVVKRRRVVFGMVVSLYLKRGRRPADNRGIVPSRLSYFLEGGRCSSIVDRITEPIAMRRWARRDG